VLGLISSAKAVTAVLNTKTVAIRTEKTFFISSALPKTIEIS